MRHIRFLFICGVLGCATTKSHVRVAEQYRSGCSHPASYLVDGGSSGMRGTTAVAGANANFGLASASSYDGSSVLPQITQDFRMRLEIEGFYFVSDSRDAEVLLVFSIGAVRYDPLAGWIADQASLVVVDPLTKERLEVHQAKSAGVTATTSKLIRKLARAAGSCLDTEPRDDKHNG